VNLLRLSKIADYLTTERNLESAVQFIAMNACPSGNLARIFLARIGNDMSLKHLASFGFSSEFVQKHDEYQLLNAENLLESIDSGVLILLASDSRLRGKDNFVDTTGESVQWKTVVYLPMLPHFAAALSSTLEIPDDEEHRRYFNTLKSLLSLYLHLISEAGFPGSQRLPRNKNVALGEKLTERQALILDLIKEGKTNIAIADRLGYSESLIRQETMAIYQKLGIEGRREISRNQINTATTNNME
jgi:DNA-binding CsgD family transcriptional regulator